MPNLDGGASAHDVGDFGPAAAEHTHALDEQLVLLLPGAKEDSVGRERWGSTARGVELFGPVT